MKESWRDITHAFFLGIGGIGMSALAQHLHHHGIKVSGFDRDETELTKKLESIGMEIVYDENQIEISPSIDIVIYTPAIKENQVSFSICQSSGVSMIKRSEALQYVLADHKVIAVAGTHGKTTTCAILSHIMHQCNGSTTSIIGGIMANYHSNFIHGDGDWIIVEADEYDRSFLRLSPEVLVIQAMDADHLDIYKDHDDMIEAYMKLTLQIPSGGSLFVTDEIEKTYLTKEWKSKLISNGVVVSVFGLGQLDEVTSDNGTTHFSLGDDRYEFPLPGDHNLMNALASIEVAKSLKEEVQCIGDAMKCFKGVERRYEFLLRGDDTIIISDYAHHPVEIASVISATRQHFPDRKITAVFQPHLYSRTRDFLNEFAEELSKADETILVNLYPAREMPIEGVSSNSILSLLENENHAFVPMKEIVEYLGSPKRELILLLGAGDLYKKQEEIVKLYS